MTGDTLIHTAAGQRTAQRFYHQTSRKMTSRWCTLIVLKAQVIPSVVWKVFWDAKDSDQQILSVIISNELYVNAQYVLPGSAAFLYSSQTLCVTDISQSETTKTKPKKENNPKHWFSGKRLLLCAQTEPFLRRCVALPNNGINSSDKNAALRLFQQSRWPSGYRQKPVSCTVTFVRRKVSSIQKKEKTPGASFLEWNCMYGCQGDSRQRGS